MTNPKLDRKLLGKLAIKLANQKPEAMFFARGQKRLTDAAIREALAGHCFQCAEELANMIGGVHRRGTYHGEIELYQDGPHWNWSKEFALYGFHRHSWVEKDGLIYDPTWWAWQANQPVAVYIFPLPDARYHTNITLEWDESAREEAANGNEERMTKVDTDSPDSA